MPLWGSKDQANNAPKWHIESGINGGTANGEVLFGTKVVGLDDGEIETGRKSAHSGWTRVQRGTGPLKSLTITAGGTGYANTDTVNVSGGTTNAAATITTDGSGVITAVTVGTAGKGFVNATATTVTITTSAGTGATLAPVLGGRAGRVQTEVLVALSSMTANNSTL